MDMMTHAFMIIYEVTGQLQSMIEMCDVQRPPRSTYQTSRPKRTKLKHLNWSRQICLLLGACFTSLLWSCLITRQPFNGPECALPSIGTGCASVLRTYWSKGSTVSGEKSLTHHRSDHSTQPLSPLDPSSLLFSRHALSQVTGTNTSKFPENRIDVSTAQNSPLSKTMNKRNYRTR